MWHNYICAVQPQVVSNENEVSFLLLGMCFVRVKLWDFAFHPSNSLSPLFTVPRNEAADEIYKKRLRTSRVCVRKMDKGE